MWGCNQAHGKVCGWNLDYSITSQVSPPDAFKLPVRRRVQEVTLACTPATPQMFGGYGGFFGFDGYDEYDGYGDGGRYGRCARKSGAAEREQCRQGKMQASPSLV